MQVLEKIKAFYEQDVFVRSIGVRIAQITEGEAICTMEITPTHLNANHVIQGGATFTLADFAFAVAAGSYNRSYVSLSSTISYMRPPKGVVLTAVAKVISKTRHTCVCNVQVCDEMGTQVACITATGYVKDMPIVEE